ncbi:hypothetical protein BDV59DRAFT_169702 [Aspergillus ambiguus]|uniref:uncharacterized protein n=1 Tax=Aspergillus ambiguus TaxID=176160 RepID=UPI003CCD9053
MNERRWDGGEKKKREEEKKRRKKERKRKKKGQVFRCVRCNRSRAEWEGATQSGRATWQASSLSGKVPSVSQSISLYTLYGTLYASYFILRIAKVYSISLSHR